MTELTCIVCPRGCRLKVDEANGYEVTGAACPRGIAYGKKELTNPTRTVTSTVAITGALHNRLPVKTSEEIDRALVQKAVDALKQVRVAAPVKTGDVVLKNVLGTGIDFIATKDMAQQKPSERMIK